LIAFYKKQGKLVTVDGMTPIEEVTKAIAEVLDRAGRKGCLSV
jgi:adenylate kinase